jgi:hypothetical protein
MLTVRPADSTGAPGVRLRRAVGELIAESLATSGRPDPERDGHVAACAVFGLMEQFLWAERTPDDADVEHLLSWILR